MGQMTRVGTHATTVARTDGILRVTYQSTEVVRVNPDGSIHLNSGGWRTHTTKTRMNQASHQYELGFHVQQKAGNWLVHTPGGAIVPFTDGMVLAPAWAER